MQDTNANAIYKGWYYFATTRECNTFSKIAKRYYGNDIYALKIAMYNNMKRYNIDCPLDPSVTLKIPLYPECVGYKIFNVKYRKDFNTQKVITIANMIKNATFYCVELDKYFFYNGDVFVEGLSVNLDCIEEREFR